ncbi:MAG: hypothetical protein M3H12_04795, partial [Chromatiales bacterium]
ATVKCRTSMLEIAGKWPLSCHVLSRRHWIVTVETVENAGTTLSFVVVGKEKIGGTDLCTCKQETFTT